MANPNPHKARAARAKKRKIVRKTGDLPALQRKLWQAITSAEEIMLDPQATDEKCLKAIHAVTQASGAYTRLLETSDLKAELDQVKEELREIKQAQGLRKAV